MGVSAERGGAMDAVGGVTRAVVLHVGAGGSLVLMMIFLIGT